MEILRIWIYFPNSNHYEILLAKPFWCHPEVMGQIRETLTLKDGISIILYITFPNFTLNKTLRCIFLTKYMFFKKHFITVMFIDLGNQLPLSKVISVNKDTSFSNIQIMSSNYLHENILSQIYIYISSN